MYNNGVGNDIFSSKKKQLAGLVAAACLCGASSASAAPAAATDSRPNVLLVIMDDLGTGQLDFALDALDTKALGKRPVAERYGAIWTR